MSITSFKQSFVANPLIIPTNKPKPRISNSIFTVSCNYPSNDSHENHANSSNFWKIEKEIAKLAVVTLIAGALTVSAVGDASAAKSGGRVGGQAFRSSAPRPSAPRSSAPRANSRTNIYVNPPVAPPLGGYGYGYGVPFYGGWGWSPFSFFAPGPSIAVGVGGGFDLIVTFMILGAVAAVVRRFRGSRREDEDDDY
ncbi:hypothetical protein RND81_08G043300 [Saponaria officinalis]|uniref:Transmembrane protein n=1 Tax=Saponaria officinalis TaxID=3572 RepID=A0AAW1J346_SAPOF